MIWIHASSAARFEQSIRDALDWLKVRGRDEPDANMLQLFQSWLRDDPRRNWLVILDNVDDAVILLESASASNNTGEHSGKRRIDYLPTCPNGKLLLTSRSKAAALTIVNDKCIIPIEPMSEQHASALATVKLGHNFDPHDSYELAKALDHIPLAITQAAAYIKQRAPRCTVAEYIDHVAKTKASKRSVLDRDEGDLRRDREAKNSIFLTWQISIERIERVRPSAADLLYLMSCFDRQAIPESLLYIPTDQNRVVSGAVDSQKGVQDDVSNSIDDSDDSLGSHDEAFEDDIAVLRGYSFIETAAKPDIFRMHRLVQLATQKWVKQRGHLELWQSRFISNLCDAFPRPGQKNRDLCHSLFPHGAAAFNVVLESPSAMLKHAQLFEKCREYARQEGSYAHALGLAQKVCMIRENLDGAEHPATCESFQRLVTMYTINGHHIKAIELGEQTLKLCEKIFGEVHPSTLIVVAELARAYGDLHQYEKSRSLGEKVLTCRRNIYGNDHRATIKSMINLSVTYERLGRYEDARQLIERVVSLKTDVLGDEHPETRRAIFLLERTKRALRLPAKVKESAIQSFEARRKTLGENHPRTIRAMGEAFSICFNEGSYQEAAALAKEVVERSKTAFGDDHPHTLLYVVNLARTMRKQGRMAESIELLGSAVDTSGAVLGHDHPDTIYRRNLLQEWTYGKNP